MSASYSPLQHYGRESPPFYRLDIAQYHLMLDAGVFAVREQCELLEGLLVVRPIKAPRECYVMAKLEDMFDVVLPNQWRVRIRCGFTLADSEPEPDLLIVRGGDRTFEKRHPDVQDLGFVVEVGLDTLRHERFMARIYARNNIPIYWIVNLVDNIIEVYTQPSGPTENPDYASRQDFARGDSVPVVLDGVTIASLPVSDLLPS
jgi:hypothetical protein